MRNGDTGVLSWDRKFRFMFQLKEEGSILLANERIGGEIESRLNW